jgi:hypothetical protein
VKVSEEREKVERETEVREKVVSEDTQPFDPFKDEDSTSEGAENDGEGGGNSDGEKGGRTTDSNDGEKDGDNGEDS